MKNNVNEFVINLIDAWNRIASDIIPDALQSLTNNTYEINFSTDKQIIAPKSFGVYLIEICPHEGFSFSKFLTDWKKDTTIVKTPNIIKRPVKIEGNDVWYPFYIGKSEKLQSRISEHCFQERHKTTYSLKLRCHSDLITQAKFRFSYYEIAPNIPDNVLVKSALQYIITNLEKELREKLSPWIGKQ